MRGVRSLRGQAGRHRQLPGRRRRERAGRQRVCRPGLVLRVLSLVGDLDSAYREFHRVLKPGGRALIYQTFATSLLEPDEAAFLLPVMGCSATAMSPENTEAAIAAAGLRIDRCVILGTEWGEYAQEHALQPGRHLLHAARLIRDPNQYIARFGQQNYDIKLGDCLWHIYRMIGKLSSRIYLLTAA
jgi:hypothetical protein